MGLVHDGIYGLIITSIELGKVGKIMCALPTGGLVPAISRFICGLIVPPERPFRRRGSSDQYLSD